MRAPSKVTKETCYNHAWEGRIRCRVCWGIKFLARGPMIPHTIKHGDMPEIATIEREGT